MILLDIDIEDQPDNRFVNVVYIDLYHTHLLRYKHKIVKEYLLNKAMQYYFE